MDFSTDPNHELLKTELQKLIQHQKSEFERIAELTSIKQKAVHDYFLVEQVSEVYSNKRTHEATTSSLTIEEKGSILEKHKKEVNEFEECVEELTGIPKRYFMNNNIHMFSVLSMRKNEEDIGNVNRYRIHREICNTRMIRN
jgi:hypothetical protein